MRDFIKNNFKVISILVIVILLGGVGLTLAYTMDNINVAIGTGEYSVVYNGTSSLPSSNLTPILDSELTSSSNLSKVLKIEFSVKGASTNPTNRDIIYDVSLTDLDLPTELQSELLKWRLYKNGTQISEGNFSKDFDLLINNRMVLTEIQQDLPNYNDNPDSYIFYMWISETCTGDITTCTEEDDASELMNKTFSGNIRIELSTGSKKELVRIPTANSPNLVDNSLVPVYYDENASTWKVASYTNEDNNWYNYDEKKWANAVLLTEDKRNSLTKDEDGNYTQNQIIGDTEASGTLAFYVWIPRYKYKVWNIDKEIGVDSYNAQFTGIDIVFEQGTSTTGTIKCDYSFNYSEGSNAETCIGNNGDYYTHPAFTFGNDEVTGIWVGKFELSSEDPNAVFEGYITGGGDSETLTPRILPNVISWRHNYVDKFWYSIYNMQKSSNIYGLPTSRLIGDSHMITNMEWGAIAYLTHSKYGVCNQGEYSICERVLYNNSGFYYTGRSVYDNSGDYAFSDEGTYRYDQKITKNQAVKGTGSRVAPKVSTPENSTSWEKTGDVWHSPSINNFDNAAIMFEFSLSSPGVVSFEYSISSIQYKDNMAIYIGCDISNNGNYEYECPELRRYEFSGIMGTTFENLVYKEIELIFPSGDHIITIEFYNGDYDYDEYASRLNQAFVRNFVILEGFELETVEVPGGQLASTTRNIYGIYDMSGGAHDIVFSNSSLNVGEYIYPGADYEERSEFYQYNGYEKYITTYPNCDEADCFKEITKLGDATGELIVVDQYWSRNVWDDTVVEFFPGYNTWTTRGGSADDCYQNSIFNNVSFEAKAGPHPKFTTRAVLIGF